MLIILVRHGATALNKAAKPIVRGWKDEPLVPSSFFDIKKTAKDLRQYAPQWLVSSEFMRDSQTAMILADQLGITDTSVDYDSRTWNVGKYSGQPEDEANQAILELYKRPWDTPEGSDESFNDFSARWTGFLDQKMNLATIEAMRPGIIVSHGRNLALTDAYYNLKPTTEGMMPMPGGYALISVTPERALTFEIPGESEPVCVDV